MPAAACSAAMHFGNRLRRHDALSWAGMIRIGNPRRARRHPAAFLLWGWAMLLVVLLSAAPTEGPPRSRLLGSAFDPASVSVVLSPKQLRLNASSSSLNKRKPDETMGGQPLIADAARWQAPELLPAAGSPAIDGTGPATSALSFTRANGPRAPPLA